jgi:hypothetical protein
VQFFLNWQITSVAATSTALKHPRVVSIEHFSRSRCITSSCCLLPPPLQYTTPKLLTDSRIIVKMTESEVSRKPKTARTDSDRSSKAGSGQHRRDRKSTPESEASAPRIPGKKHKRHVSNDALQNSSSNLSTPSSTAPSKGAHPPSSLPTPNPLNDPPLRPAPIRDGEVPASPSPTKQKVPDVGPASPNRRENKVPASPVPARDDIPTNPSTRRKQKTPASPAPAIEKPSVVSTRIEDKIPASLAPAIEKPSASSTRRKDKVPVSPVPTRDEVPASSTRRKDKNPVSTVEARDEGLASSTRRKDKVRASSALRRDEAPASPTRRKGKTPTKRAPNRAASSTGPRRDSALAREKDPASPGPRRGSAPARNKDSVSPAPIVGDIVPASPAPRKEKFLAIRAPVRDEFPASPGPRRGSAPASSASRKDRVPASPAPTRDEVPATPTLTKDKISTSRAPKNDEVPASPGPRRDSAPSSSAYRRNRAPTGPAQTRDAVAAGVAPRKDAVPASPAPRKEKVPASPAPKEKVPASRAPARSDSAPATSIRKNTNSASPAPREDTVPASPALRKGKVPASRAPARSDSAPASSAHRKDRVPASSAQARDEVPVGPAPGKDSAPASLSPENMPVGPPSRRMRSYEIGENSFDVDAPRDSVRQRQDCVSVAESTVVGLTEEERAWAGIEAVLNDIESVATHDVLPEAVIISRSSSSSSKPATSFLGKGMPEDDDGDNDIDSHDAFMEGLNAEQSSDGDDMPLLASYSSLMTTLSIAQSIISCLSKRDLIPQDDLVDNPMKEFIGSITETLERKQQAGPAPSPDGGDAIFSMFSWSSKKNVDEIKGETEGSKGCFTERHPEHGILTSPQKRKKVFSSPLVFVPEDVCNDPMPSLSDHSMPSRSEYSMPSLSVYSTPSLSEYSMPSLSSVRESEVSYSTHARGKSASFTDLNFDCGRISISEAMDPSSTDMSEKWASFGDLDVDYGRVAPTDQKVQFGDMTQTAERRSTKTKTKKAPKPLLKKKKLKKKIRPIEEIKEINAPEALLDYYKAPELAVSENPASASKRDKYGVATMRTFKSPVASLRCRMPKLGLFGKGRRNSPTSITDGCHDSQFYPEMDDDAEEGEEFGGLLYS